MILMLGMVGLAIGLFFLEKIVKRWADAKVARRQSYGGSLRKVSKN